MPKKNKIDISGVTIRVRNISTRDISGTNISGTNISNKDNSIVFNYDKLTLSTYKNQSVNTYNNIPCQVFQTYKNVIPENVKEGMMKLRKQNPEFRFYYYNDDDMQIFIKNNYGPRVLKAFNKLIPGSYKADLFRYCVLYKYGGVYLDIKLVMADDKKLITLVKDKFKEYHVIENTEFTRLRTKYFGGFVYQGVMMSRAGNPFLRELISVVVDRCERSDPGTNPLDITGPNIYWKVLQKHKYSKDFDCSTLVHVGDSNIYYKYDLFITGHELEKYDNSYGTNRYYNNWPSRVFHNTNSGNKTNRSNNVTNRSNNVTNRSNVVNGKLFNSLMGYTKH